MSTAEVQIIAQELTDSARRVNPDGLAAIRDKVQSHGRIFVYATGRSGLMIKAFAMRLMQIGLTSYVVGETTTPAIQAGDLLVTASASGETASVCQIAAAALKQGANVSVISSVANSPLAEIQAPDLVIESSTKLAQSEITVQPLGSLFEQMLLIVFDALILQLTAAHSGSNADMADRHASLE